MRDMTLEERVEQLEKKVAELEAKQALPRDLRITSNIPFEISEFYNLRSSHLHLIEQMNKEVIPAIWGRLENLSALLVDPTRPSEQPSKEN